MKRDVPPPADFHVVAFDLAEGEIVQHYNSTVYQVRFWMAAQPREWRLKRQKHIKRQAALMRDGRSSRRRLAVDDPLPDDARQATRMLEAAIVNAMTARGWRPFEFRR